MHHWRTIQESQERRQVCIFSHFQLLMSSPSTRSDNFFSRYFFTHRNVAREVRFCPSDLAQLRRRTIFDVICDNIDHGEDFTLQPRPFFKSGPENAIIKCRDAANPLIPEYKCLDGSWSAVLSIRTVWYKTRVPPQEIWRMTLSTMTPSNQRTSVRKTLAAYVLLLPKHCAVCRR